MINEGIIFMEGGGGHMDREFRVPEKQPFQKTEQVEVPHGEGRKEKPALHHGGVTPPAPEIMANIAEAAKRARERDAQTADKPFMPAPEVAEVKSEEQEKEKVDTFQEAIAAAKNGDADEALGFLKSHFIEKAGEELDESANQELERKVSAIEGIFRESLKPKDERSQERIVDTLRNAKPDAATNKVLREHLLRQGFSEEEIKNMYDLSDQPQPAPQNGGNGDEVSPSPTGEDEKLTDEEKAEIHALPDAMNEAIKNGDIKKAGEIANRMGEFSKRGLSVLLKTLLYTAITAYIAYVFLMAKTGKMVEKAK